MTMVNNGDVYDSNVIIQTTAHKIEMNNDEKDGKGKVRIDSDFLL